LVDLIGPSLKNNETMQAPPTIEGSILN
jgi:hypothetical protein